MTASDPTSTSPPPPPEWERIGRYLAGESSPEEAAVIRRWLQEHPADAELIAALNSATTSAAAPTAIEVEAALARVKQRARTGARSAALRFAGFAAVAAALLAAAVLIPWGSVLNRGGASSRLTAPVAFSTQTGQRDSVTLPDSSLVVLGPKSRITYATQDDMRIVHLDGQAFFRVMHESRRQFIVRTRSASVRDIGTAFSVQNTDIELERVVVHEGIVEIISPSGGGDTLRAGDVAVIAASGKVETSRGIATADDVAWMQGQVVFRDTPVSDIASDLRRWYGVELQVTDSALLRRHFTGVFVAGEPGGGRSVVNALAMAIGARVESRGDTLILRSAR